MYLLPRLVVLRLNGAFIKKQAASDIPKRPYEAGDERIELPLRVLETPVMPFDQSPTQNVLIIYITVHSLLSSVLHDGKLTDIYMTVLEIMNCSALFAGLGAAAYTDIKSRRIPNIVPACMVFIRAALLLCAAAAVGWAAADLNAALGGVTAADSLAGAVLGGGIFLIVYLIPKKALGAGDVKLMAAAGLYLGSGKILCAALFGMAAALMFSVCALMLQRRAAVSDTAAPGTPDAAGRGKAPAAVPLAPFILLGSALAVMLVK